MADRTEILVHRSHSGHLAIKGHRSDGGGIRARTGQAGPNRPGGRIVDLLQALLDHTGRRVIQGNFHPGLGDDRPVQGVQGRLCSGGSQIHTEEAPKLHEMLY